MKLLGSILLCAVFTSAQAADPVPGKSPRYCNPLPMVSDAGASASGDVTVIRDNGKSTCIAPAAVPIPTVR
jgi:hypothetical protein